MARTIGRYEIESEIGRGSMGVVYLARDPRVRRRVALKSFHLPGSFTEDQRAEYRARFLREAQAAGGLTHPGIVTIYDVDEDPSSRVPFIAMEHVPGRSLAELLEVEGRVDPERAIAWHAALAEALHVAHEAGVVHRDVKPANILVREPEGTVTIADFGVARLSASTLTRTGETVGSPAYMSPEQLQAGPTDGRSDLFSLAVILYRCLTGELPFAGDNIAALAYAVVHGEYTPPSTLVAGLPEGIDAFFERALAKRPDERFPHGTAFRDALGELAGAPSAAAPVLLASSGIAAGTPELIPLVEIEDEAPAVATLAQESAGHGIDPPRQRPRGRFRPGWRLAAALALIAVALIVGLALRSRAPAAAPASQAYLLLEGRSRLDAGTLTILVDEEEVFSRQLTAPRRGPKFLGRNRPKIGAESFEAWITVEPGSHQVVAEVVPDGAGVGARRSASLEIGDGDHYRLQLAIGRDVQRSLSLRVEPVEPADQALPSS